MDNPDPESISWMRVAFAFVVVFGLMALLGLILKYLNLRGIGNFRTVTKGPRRLEIVESLMVDMRRRLVIIRRDDTEHLLLLGQTQDIVVETHLKKNQNGPSGPASS